MFAGGTKRHRLIGVLWWLGAAISAITLLAHKNLYIDVDLSRRSPFDNTGAVHAEQWTFLREASHHVPRGATFTVLAPDRDTEMGLFMMAVGLLPESSPVPTSYYGRLTGRGDLAEYVLRFGETGSLPPSEIPVASINGGQVTQRPTTEP